MNSYGCYLRNARTSLIICCRRLLMRDGRHQLNILRKVLAEYCIYEILGITEVGEQLEAQHGIDSYIILGRLGRDGMIAERYTRSKHAPD
ncbi:unnamed protein product, partial [Fusarium graminearum]